VLSYGKSKKLVDSLELKINKLGGIIVMRTLPCLFRRQVKAPQPTSLKRELKYLAVEAARCGAHMYENWTEGDELAAD